MFEIVDGDFIWDTDKELLNIKRHGVSFRLAIQVFVDPHRVIEEDLAHSQSEERFYCFGRIDGKVLTVRFTHRNNMIRIIGAGYWRKGRKFYEEKT